jgi:hypothetical protein
MEKKLKYEIGVTNLDGGANINYKTNNSVTNQQDICHKTSVVTIVVHNQ